MRLVFANFLAPNMTPIYAEVAACVGRAVGCETTLVTGTDDAQLLTPAVDVGFVCGLPYVRLAGRRPSPLRALAAPVLRGERYAGRPVYFSDVIVQRDRPWQTFADLRGQSWAYNQPDSYSGCVITRLRLLQLGETERFFGQVRFTGSHQASIAQVQAGQVDASAIDSHVLGIELRNSPTLRDQLRVIDAFGPSTIPPVVATARVPQSLAEELTAALCALAVDPTGQSSACLARGLIERFVPIDDRAYDDIRRAVGAVDRAYGLPRAATA